MSDEKSYNINRYKDFETLKNRLKNKNVIIDDSIYFLLENLSYSNIAKGFKATEFVDNLGNFKKEVTTTEILNLFILDRSLSNFLFKYVLYIENFLNANISRIVASNFGTHSSENESDIHNVKDYLYTENYLNSSEKLKILNILKSRIKKPVNNTSMGYYKKCKNYYPPWVLFNSIYLSDSIKFSKILKSNHKNELINSILKFESELKSENRADLFFKLLNCILKFRNQLAHPSLIVKNKLSDSERLPFNYIQKYTKNILIDKSLNDNCKNSVIFSLIIGVSILINNNSMIKEEFLNDLYFIFANNQNFKFMDLNLYETFKIPETIYEDIMLFFKFMKID